MILQQFLFSFFTSSACSGKVKKPLYESKDTDKA